jgi:hypothetical protein
MAAAESVLMGFFLVIFPCIMYLIFCFEHTRAFSLMCYFQIIVHITQLYQYFSSALEQKWVPHSDVSSVCEAGIAESALNMFISN